MSVQVSGSGHGMDVIRHLTCGWRGLPAHLSGGLRGPPGLQYRACGCPPAHLGRGLRGPPGLQYRAWYLCNKGTKSKSHKQVGDGQMPRKCQLRVQRSFDWTEEAEVSAGTKRARDFPFGGQIPLALESRAEVFFRRTDANKPCYTQIVRLALLDAAGAQEGRGGRKLDL
ncbi:hypothetical protein NDU88_007283 [Pleurodeles waltl]|uniref:Uncharacterized protein n=1 Tax=Pleurodeles waltl TaxID=8319 RepID=A0AAV7PL70_PLEWA|nr:hypothetical protein NDU88_007283 [Pleurodeles waltl]